MVSSETIKNLGLKDIHTGPEPTALREFLIYGSLAVIAVIAAAYIIYRLVPVFRALLSFISAYFKSSRYPQELNRLLKDSCMIFYKRDQVAKLIGNDWLNFLDHRSLSNFSSFRDRWDELLYSQCEVTRKEKRSLLINSILWILSNFWRALWLK